MELLLRRVSSVTELTSSKIAALTRYWDAKRGSRAMPTWNDIDPAEIKPLLPHLLVTRYETHPFRAKFVLVGTWLAQYAGGDFTGRYLDEMDFTSEFDTDWPAVHRRFVAEAKPLFAICRFTTEYGLESVYECAMLPLAGPDGTSVGRCLGIEDFPVGAAVDERIVADPPRLLELAEGRNDPYTIKPHLEAIPPGDAALRRSLAEAGLPAADLAGPDRFCYRLVEGGKTCGFGAIELFGEAALLRGLVVPGPNRGHGYGRSLAIALIDELRRRGVREAYVVAETALSFFAALDFLPCPPESAPPAIRGSGPASELAAGRAKLLRRGL
jgi:amino-acid N-acetyltransferase